MKGRELAALLAGYEDELHATGQVDYAGVLRLAAAQTQSLPSGAMLLLPEDLEHELSLLDRALWQAIPAGRRVILETDHPGEAPEAPLTDAACLRWLATPTAAPATPGDGTATIFRAVGEVNEVREALSRCLAEGLALDEVEILYTDSGTYLPLLYEFASRLWGEQLPVTFIEGLPVRYSRPARALLGWLTWVREDFAQAALVRLIQDGLLEIAGCEEAEVSYAAPCGEAARVAHRAGAGAVPGGAFPGTRSRLPAASA